MRLVDMVLEVIRENPGGISTAEIVASIFPDLPYCQRRTREGSVYKRCADLRRFGLVLDHIERRPRRNGSEGPATIWRPAE